MERPGYTISQEQRDQAIESLYSILKAAREIRTGSPVAVRMEEIERQALLAVRAITEDGKEREL